MNELISIIIPVYNNEKWFERCIKSAINQTYKNIEIIIINDCSIDNVEEIINKYLSIDKRIIYLKNEVNKGVGYSRNREIDISKGQYIYFLDSDDYIENNLIETLYNNIKKSDTYCCLQSAFKEIDGIKTQAHRSIEDLELLKSPSVCIRLFNKRIINESKVRFSNIKVAEDLEFVFKLLIYNSSVSYVDKPLYTYVIHNDSSIRSYTDEQLDAIKAIDSIIEYAKINNKYDQYKEIIEFVAVDHILVGTINRIIRMKDYNKNNIDRCIDYINKNFQDWKNNDYVKRYILSNERIIQRFEELNIYSEKNKMI